MACNKALLRGVYQMLSRLFSFFIGSELGARSLRNVAIKLVSIPIALVTNIVLARVLGVDGLGVYGVSISIIMILAMPVVTSLDTFLIRHVGKLHCDNSGGRILHATKFALFNIFLATAIYAVFVLLYLQLMPEVVYSQVLPYTLIFYPAILLLAIGGSFLRSIDHVTMGVLPEQILRQLIFLSAIGVMFFWFSLDQYSAKEAIRLHAFSNVITVVIVFVMLLYGIRSIKGGCFTGISDSLQWKQYYSTYWPLLILGFVQVASTHVPMLVIGSLGKNTDAGLFRVAEQLVGLASLGLVSVNLAFGPMFAKLTKDKAGMQAAITKACGLILLMVVPATLVLMLWPDVILVLLFGEEFESAASVLRIMCIGAAFSALIGPVALVLNILGLEKSTLRGMRISLVVNVIASLILIPNYGAIGAAISFCLANIVWNGVLLLSLFRQTGLSTIPYIVRPKLGVDNRR